MAEGQSNLRSLCVQKIALFLQFLLTVDCIEFKRFVNVKKGAGSA